MGRQADLESHVNIMQRSRHGTHSTLVGAMNTNFAQGLHSLTLETVEGTLTAQQLRENQMLRIIRGEFFG